MLFRSAGTYDVPAQNKSMPGLLSASTDKLKGKERSITGVPAYVTGPASRACGSCHRAELIKADNASSLKLFNQHITNYGFLVEAGATPDDTLKGVFDQIMGLFK